ncbi:hypothetical protein [Bradyrhizobium sp. USDA 4486]
MVAITALAFFKADVGRADVLLTAGAFVIGMFFVVLAQVAAFLAMSKRAEVSTFYWSEQFQRIAALQMNHLNSLADADANSDRAIASTGVSQSNVWRLAGIVCFGLSLTAFVFGCGWGAWIVRLAREIAAR